MALVGNPRVALLDELSTGLDPQARRRIWAVVGQLRDDGVTVLLVSHLMEEVERLCDRVALIDRGRLIALDSPAGLIARAGRIAADTGTAAPCTTLDDAFLTLTGQPLRTARDSEEEPW